MYALDFDHRSDGGPSLIGPFGSETAAQRWVDNHYFDVATYKVRPMHVPDLS